MATIQANTVRQYKDLDLHFTAHPVKKDVVKHVNEMAVINSVKNLILTNHYERPFQPDVGSNIQRLLFENMDNITASSIQREIAQTINNYEPRIVVQSIQVSPDFDNNSYNIGMQFYIVNRTEPISIQFFLQRTR